MAICVSVCVLAAIQTTAVTAMLNICVICEETEEKAKDMQIMHSHTGMLQLRLK
jgi:hypothetical protein